MAVLLVQYTQERLADARNSPFTAIVNVVAKEQPDVMSRLLNYNYIP